MIFASLIYLYLVVFYLVPFVLSILFGWHANFILLDELHFLVGFFGVFVASVFACLSVRIKGVFKPFIRLNSKGLLLNVFFLLIAAVFFTSTIVMSSKYGSSFRHTGPSMSEIGFLGYVYFISRSICPVILVYVLRLAYVGQVFRGELRCGCFLIGLSYFLFPIAAFDFFYGSIFIMASISGFLLDRALSVGFKKAVFISIPIVFGVVFFGLGNKVGIRNVFEVYFGDGFLDLLNYLQYRNGVFYFSSVINNSLNFGYFNNVDLGINVLLNMLDYRFGLLLGFDVDKPIISNLNVLNFSQVYVGYTSGQEIGASPGLLSAFNFVAPFPLGLILMCIFLYILKCFFSYGFPVRSDRYGYSGYVFALLIIFFGFLNNPIHVFTAVGPDLFKSLLLLFVLSLRISN